MALVLALLLLCASGTSNFAAAALTSPPPSTPEPTCSIGFHVVGNGSGAMCMALQSGLKTWTAASAYCAFLAVDGTLASADIPKDAALARSLCNTSAAAGRVRFRNHWCGTARELILWKDRLFVDQ